MSEFDQRMAPRNAIQEIKTNAVQEIKTNKTTHLPLSRLYAFTKFQITKRSKHIKENKLDFHIQN